MKRLVVATCLVLSSGPAYGEWLLVVSNDTEGVTVYADPNTVRRKGDLVKMWTLFDFKTTQSVGDISCLSSKGQDEYDCAEERIRQLALTNFSSHMGQGKVVHSDADAEEWAPVSPNSVGKLLWDLACGKP